MPNEVSQPQSVPLYADQALQQATAHHKAGQLQDAEQLYRAILQTQPMHPDANHNLGVLAVQVKQPAAGLHHLKAACEAMPNVEKYWLSYANAQYKLGNAQIERGTLDDAMASYKRALGIKPDLADAYGYLGVTHQEIGQFDKAVVNYGRAIVIKPDSVKAYNNLGAALVGLGKFDDAVASCTKALHIKPDYVKAYNNLGAALVGLGKPDAAAASYNRSLTIAPDYFEARNNLGNALAELGRLDDAVISFHRAIECKPDLVDAHNNIGLVLMELGRLDDAVVSYRRALEIMPDCFEAHSNLLYIRNYQSHPHAESFFSEVQHFGVMAVRKARPYSEWANPPVSDRCLHVGLVSGDFRNHPVGYFIESIVAAIAADSSIRLKLFAYPSYTCNDALAERIKSCCHGWHSAVGLSDERLAEQIRNDGIDILVDLSGHTRHNRLPVFGWRPAPVQVTWLGYFATTGVDAIDYLIADPWTLLKSEEGNFTERIWRLPDTRLCFTTPDVDIGVNPLPARRTGQLTFCCFNNITKMNDRVVALWAKVLNSVPDSRLFLKSKQLREVSARDSVMARFGVHGVTADRLILEDYEPRQEYLTAYHRVDIALDPFPFPGGTTTVESLWMGVPVLTLAGESFLSRQGVGLLMNAGLRDWIAADMDDYVVRAVSFAGDIEALATLRRTLRRRVLASPLFEAPIFARHIEAALRGMWTQWCDRHPSMSSSTPVFP